MTLTFDTIVTRAIEAIRRAHADAGDRLPDMSTREIREIHEAAVMAEFQALREWRVTRHTLVGTYVIQNSRTRELYKAGARGGAKKIVVFKHKSGAEARANELNLLEDAKVTK